MLPNNFIFSETESLFQQKLDSNEIKNTAIAFMADTGRIWTHGVWFCTALTAEDIQNLIDQSTTLQEFLQSLSPAEVSVSDTQPTREEKIWINGNTISFNNGGSWSTPINLDNFLSKNNELEYTPVGDYNPATKLYVDDSIKAAVGSVYKVKGSVANYDALPTSNVEIGDVYNLTDTGANYVATNNDPIEWDKLSETVDTSIFLAKDNTTEFTPTGEYNPATKGYVDSKATTSSITIPSVPTYSPDPESDPEGNADLVTGDNLQTIIGKLLYKIQSLETELANFKAAILPEGQSIVYINK